MEANAGRDLRALPKAHLHLHLEGAMRSSTLTELCQRYGIDRPADTKFRQFDGFGGFLKMYWAACDVIRSREDLSRLILEVAEDAAGKGFGGSSRRLTPIAIASCEMVVRISSF